MKLDAKVIVFNREDVYESGKSKILSSKLDIYSKAIPDYVRAILLCSGEMDIQPDPYTNIECTFAGVIARKTISNWEIIKSRAAYLNRKSG